MRPRRRPGVLRRLVPALVAPVLGASLFLAAAGGVAAADPPGLVYLDTISCDIYDFDADFNVRFYDVVPAGSEVVLFQAWITNTRGQLQSFINNATWVMTVNGQDVDVTPSLTGLVPLGPSAWGDLFFQSVGTFADGDTLMTHYDNVVKSATFDGVFHYAKGSVYNGGYDCNLPVSADWHVIG
jgi:hypothetical protein